MLPAWESLAATTLAVIWFAFTIAFDPKSFFDSIPSFPSSFVSFVGFVCWSLGKSIRFIRRTRVF